MKKQQIVNSFLLFITAAVWGVAFVAQSAAADHIGAFTFNCIRSIIGGIVLLPVSFAFGAKPPKQPAARRASRKRLLIYGAGCGALLMVASNLQQLAINNGAQSGKAGFITACYIVFVPLIGLFFKRKCSPFIWVAVVFALVGLYLLCMTDSFAFELSDILLIACAFVFTFHILYIDHVSPLVSGVKLSCVQFFVCGLLSAVPMMIFERPSVSDILAAWMPITYAGVFSCGVGYTLQIVGQKGLNPTVASLIMSCESAIAAVSGWLILGQNMTPREIVGCVVMFAAIVLAQLPTPNRKIRRRSE